MFSRTTRTTILLLTITLLSGCAGLMGKNRGSALSGQINGTITYQERIALPPDARIIVSLEDQTRPDRSGTFIAQQILEPRTQVPIPFSLRYVPAAIDLKHHYAISAAIIDGNEQLLWATDASVPVDFAQQDKPLAITVSRMLSRVEPPRPVQQGAVPFKCNDISLIARFSEGMVEIALSGRSINLPQVVSASGARYTDGQTLFWNKGDEAQFEWNGRAYEGCRVDHEPAQKKPVHDTKQ